MSGVFGLAGLQDHDNICDRLERMGDSLRHCDWHSVESAAIVEAGMGLGRMGIGIFNQGQQPVWNADHNLMLVMAGEVYAPVSDDLTDEQIILKLYAEYGDRFVEQVKGAFVAAIWDERKGRLVIANDRYGLYPLYYAHYKHKLVFAPEMKAIFRHDDFQKTLDRVAVAEYVRFQFLLGDRTFFEDIKLLPNASILCYEPATDRLDVQTYWDVSQIPQAPPSLTFNEAADEAGRLLKAAINRLYGKDAHRVGLYLSGGLDSRVNLGLLEREHFPVMTITYGPSDSSDVVYAGQLARRFNTDHHYFEFAGGAWVKDYADLHLTLTEGFHSWIHAHGLSIAAQARQLMDVNLTGLGGEPYNWEDDALFKASDPTSFTLRLYHALSQEATWPSLTDAEERLLFAPDSAPDMIGLAFDSYLTALRQNDHFSHRQQIMHFTFNSDRRLYQYYTVFNRAFIEQRFPFFDYDYFDFIRTLPADMIFDRQLRRAIVLNLAPAAAAVPYSRDGLPLTRSRFSRSARKGIQRARNAINRHVAPIFPTPNPLYADYENWLRHDLRDWGREIVLGEQTLERGLFNPAFLHSIWARHQAGYEPDMIGKIAPLMTLELFLRRYMEG